MRGHSPVRLPMRLAAVLAALLLAACVHKIDIEQGNYVTEDLVAKLKPGMTKAEVKQLLGTPLLADIFHGNRWDYYFSNAKGRQKPEKRHLVVLFKDEKVTSFSGDANPPPRPPAHPERPQPVIR